MVSCSYYASQTRAAELDCSLQCTRRSAPTLGMRLSAVAHHQFFPQGTTIFTRCRPTLFARYSYLLPGVLCSARGPTTCLITQIYALMEKVELERQQPHRPKMDNFPVLQNNFLSSNYPEETDEDSMLSDKSVYGGPSPKTNGVSALQFQQHKKAHTQGSRTPCESEESDFFSNFPTPRSRAGEEAASPDSSTLPESNAEVKAGGVHDMEKSPCHGTAEGQKESRPLPSASSTLEESQSPSSTSQLEERGASKPESSKKNNAKEKLLQKIALYEEGQIDSSELHSLY